MRAMLMTKRMRLRAVSLAATLLMVFSSVGCLADYEEDEEWVDEGDDIGLAQDVILGGADRVPGDPGDDVGTNASGRDISIDNQVADPRIEPQPQPWEDDMPGEGDNGGAQSND